MSYLKHLTCYVAASLSIYGSLPQPNLHLLSIFCLVALELLKHQVT